MKNRNYYVYILTNKNNSVLYTGVTNNLSRRMFEHQEAVGFGSVFTKKYKIKKLVYYEVFQDAYNAISREKQIKAGSRKKKIELINNFNKNWKNLVEDILPE